MAHLVGLAFAVAASANLPCIVLTLYWRRCNPGGIIAGMVVGTVTAIGLVLVSPNMTYPVKDRADAEKTLAAAPAKRLGLQTSVQQAEPAARQSAGLILGRLKKDVKKAEDDLQKYAGKTTSLVGLEKPLIALNSVLKKAISALFQPAIPVQARNRSTTNQSLGSD